MDIGQGSFHRQFNVYNDITKTDDITSGNYDITRANDDITRTIIMTSQVEMTSQGLYIIMTSQGLIMRSQVQMMTSQGLTITPQS